jgi:hypothetical protein
MVDADRPGEAIIQALDFEGDGVRGGPDGPSGKVVGKTRRPCNS